MIPAYRELLPGYRIFEADDDDIPYVLDCVRREILLSVPADEARMADLWLEDILTITRERVSGHKEGGAVFIVHDTDGRASGSLWLERSRDQYTVDGTGYVMGIFVEPFCRGRGIGTALLRYAEEWCKEEGLLHLTLNVGGANLQAKSFYESRGYRVRSEVRRKDLF